MKDINEELAIAVRDLATERGITTQDAMEKVKTVVNLLSSGDPISQSAWQIAEKEGCSFSEALKVLYKKSPELFK